MKVHLVRHGTSEWNLIGKWQGNADIPLSEQGMYQAELVAEELLNIAPNASLLFCSDLERARETAERIGEKFNLSPIIREDLRECNFSLWNGLTYEEVIENYEREFILWSSDPYAKIEGIESLSQLERRALRAFDEICEISRLKNSREIVIVGHGLWFRVLLCSLLGMPLVNHKQLELENTSITTLEKHERRGWILSSLNYHHHLSVVKGGERNKD
ncbi:hypothetical protein AT15_09430 [Kosmotoga arenicorallina S304]|uniref:Phosphoglycerate mutase n=1 Tax=Kosmotoga arenicorallina S304 TaxID=1453497 RepID=A0A176K1P2_9BACT|nr:histidine phosphatase family protein [Kosmotoga arenicorallina]OAA30894.1 hypothetical protein AT15_09430 [Kosmotoga arenicorallina S304]